MTEVFIVWMAGHETDKGLGLQWDCTELGPRDWGMRPVC